MVAVLSFFVVLVFSLIVVRVASVALSLTGLSRESAKFQARSAWTGTGFTTSESESVVSHPVRRRIVSILMVVRGAGLVTAVASLLLSFQGSQSGIEDLERFSLLVVSLLVVWLVSLSDWVDRWMTRAVKSVLGRWGDLEDVDRTSLLHIAGEYDVSELQVQEGDWLAGRALTELDLPSEGVLVLGVSKEDGEFQGAPRGRTVLEAGDRLVVYGKRERIKGLDERPQDLVGEAARRSAMRKQHEDEEVAAERLERGEVSDEAGDDGEAPEREAPGSA